MSARVRCPWCGHERSRLSDWEQDLLSGGTGRMCTPCANKRLRNPFNALLVGFRRVGEGGRG